PPRIPWQSYAGSSLRLGHLPDRPVVLLDEIAETSRHFVGAGERRLIDGCVLDFASQAEFKAFQAFSNLCLEAFELPCIPVQTVITEPPHLPEDLVEIGGVDAVVAQLVAELLRFVRPIARLVAVLADFARVVHALAPASPIVAAVSGAAVAIVTA